MELQGPPRWADLFVRDLRVPLGVLCTGVLLNSMNSLLMATVMPSAVKDIGGLEYMTWTTTGFLAASVIGASAGGIAGAKIGARSAYMLAALIFTLGSLLSGLAPDIGSLIAGRIVQGAGGGLQSALAYVIVRNMFPVVLWPRVFALFSSVWGISALAGPLIGGVFAGLGLWRGSFLVVALLALTLATLARFHFQPDADRAKRPDFPALRLLLIALAITMLSLAAPATVISWQIGFIITASILFAAMLRFDRVAAVPVLPSDAFSLNTAAGLGLWVLFLITAANDPFPIFGPLFLQTLHGMDPLTAGYVVAVEAMSWTVVAAVVASMPDRWAGVFVVTGPFFMGVGLIVISAVTDTGPIWLLLVGVFLAGGGIGACFTHLTRAILTGAKANEGDAAAAAIPTVQLVGLATGAALAGIVANATGFSRGLSVETARTASYWVPGIFALLNGAATFAAIRLIRRMRP